MRRLWSGYCQCPDCQARWRAYLLSVPEDHWVLVSCRHCGGEGRLYTSRYGGNDPDVYDVGECEHCEGTGSCYIEAQPLELEDCCNA